MLRLIPVFLLTACYYGPVEDPQAACTFGVQDGWVREGCHPDDLPAALVFECESDGIRGYDEDTARQWGTTEGIQACRSSGGSSDFADGDVVWCYDEGWADCEDLIPPAEYTDLACDNAYIDGYCDCEAYYDDFEWCAY